MSASGARAGSKVPAGLRVRTGMSALWGWRNAVIFVGAFIIVWAALAAWLDLPAIVLPSPAAVGGALADNLGLYIGESGITILETFLGFVFGATVGFISAVSIFYSATLRRGLYPLMLGMRIVPKVAFVPLFLVWFGIGLGSKIALTTFGVFFLMLVQTLLGLERTKDAQVELGRSFRMSELLIFRKIRLPSALPAIMVGMKLSLTYGLVLAVVGEMTVARAGVGWLIVDASARLQTAEMLGAIVIIAVLGLGLYGFATWVERATTFWHREEGRL